jgi:hypothetical protein
MPIAAGTAYAPDMLYLLNFLNSGGAQAALALNFHLIEKYRSTF